MSRLSFALMTFFLLLFTGCENDDFAVERGKENQLTLSYHISGVVSASTRASVPVETGEDQIHSFYLLFFENKPEGDGTFIAAIDALENRSSLFGNSGKLEINLLDHPVLSVGKAYNILFCANYEEYATVEVGSVEDWESLCTGYTENEVVEMLKLQISGMYDDSANDEQNRILSSDLPMTARAVTGANQKQVQIELIRSVSRFDVINEVEGYELLSASLWNAYTTTLLWEGTTKDFSGKRTERYYGVEAADNQIVGGLYGFENFVESPVPGDAVTTALVLGMKNLTTGETEFFRTNIHGVNASQQLKRNNVYRSTIKDVVDQGFGSEREAYESDQVLLVSDINGWTANIGGNVVFDDDNILALPSKLITLKATGDTRTYEIYTDGEGELNMTTEGVPSGVTIELNGNTLSIDAPASSVEWSGTIQFSIGNLTNSMRIEQSDYFTDYLDIEIGGVKVSDVKDLPVLGYEAGQVSSDITINSSGRWVAEIYGATYFSFDGATTQVAVISGEPGEKFNIHTLTENSVRESRQAFVVISLEDEPEVSRALVMEQAGYEDRYIRFNTSELTRAYTEGYVTFTIYSNSSWEAELIIEQGTQAGFTDNSYTKQKITGNNNVTNIKVYLPANYTNKPVRVIVRATVDDSNISADLVITQAVYYTGELFITNADGVSTLWDTSSANYKYIVYNLGENMRNTSLFGNGGDLVDMPNGGFTFKKSTTAIDMKEAGIIQFVTDPTPSIFNSAYAQHQDDPSKLFIFSSHSYSIPMGLLKKLQAKKNLGYGEVTTVTNQVSGYRDIYQKANNLQHPLMQYLLDGPAGTVNPAEILLQSGNGPDSGGLKDGDWPSTFVPIIKSANTHVNNTSGKEYCIFGIDPVNRLILIMDPAIFGAISSASATQYPNKNNYVDENSANTIFLNNFIAWMARVAVEGEEFLRLFQ